MSDPTTSPSPSLTPTTPATASNTDWRAFRRTSRGDLWQPQRTVYIAIIDTGIDSNHPDLANKMRRHSNGAVYGYNTLSNTTNALDDNGHGTHCAGIAAAEINNGIGVAGVAAWNPAVANSNAYVQLMPVKTLNSSGSGSLDAVARGITWAADNGAHILSLSLGAGSGAQQLQDAVNYAWTRGCLVVVAAGTAGVPRRSILRITRTASRWRRPICRTRWRVFRSTVRG